MELNEAINFIDKIISYKYEFNKEDFTEFGLDKAIKIAAIDGSSIKILDGGSFSVALIRVGYVIAGEEIKNYIKNIELEVVDEESKIDEIREMKEMELINEIDAELILVDGSVKANEKIVGISKKSSYRTGLAPFLFLIKKAGDGFLPYKRWYYKIDESIYAVKFHPYSRFAFRVDFNGNPDETFPKIAPFCNDISCLGYPYPLAIIHRMVEIKKGEGNYIKNVIKSKMMKKIDDDEWENIFYDYHEYLEG